MRVARAPMVPVAAAMVAGIVLGRYLAAPVAVWLVAAAACVAGAAAVLRWPGMRRVGMGLVAGAILLAAAAAGGRAWHRVAADHIVTFSDRSAVMATIRGRVASVPSIRDSAAFSWREPQTSFLLDATGIRSAEGQWLRATGPVRVTVKEPVTDLRAGGEVELIGQLTRPRLPGNPGQYNRRRADRYRGILAEFTVPGADGVLPLGDSSDEPVMAAWRWLRARATAHVTGLGDRDETVLLEALVLGTRRAALGALNRTMAEAGVAHLLSISGLHLGIFLGFVYWLCRLIALSRRRAAGLVLIVLAAYVLVTEPRAPLLRGAIMATAVCVGVIIDRRLSVLNALATAAVVLLTADPLQLFTPGFQLSFTIVTGVALLLAPVQSLLFGRWLERRGLMAFGRGDRWRRWLYYHPAQWLILLVCVSLVAYVSAAPLVAFHFGLFSPYAALLSMLLLPIVVAVLLPAYLSLGMSWLMPNAAWQVGRAARAAGDLLQWSVMTLRHLPWLSVEVSPLPAALVLLCYATLGMWAASGRIRLGRATAAALTAACVAWIAWTQLPAAPPAGATLHVLDVGHGAMILLHTAEGRTVVFDAGSMSPAGAYRPILRPFLRTQRLPSPRTAFISHPNADHYNALIELLARRPLEKVYLNASFGLGHPVDPALGDLMDAMVEADVQIARLTDGDKVKLARNAEVEVVWPPGKPAIDKLDANNTSLVLRLTVGSHRVLLTGDIQETVQRRLADGPGERIAADVLVLPHHGSATDALKDFINATGAATLVQSAAWRHDSPAFLDAISDRRRLATFRDGWIRIDLDADGITTHTMRGP